VRIRDAYESIRSQYNNNITSHNMFSNVEQNNRNTLGLFAVNVVKSADDIDNITVDIIHRHDSYQSGANVYDDI
jgi:hypothetical protein